MQALWSDWQLPARRSLSFCAWGTWTQNHKWCKWGYNEPKGLGFSPSLRTRLNMPRGRSNTRSRPLLLLWVGSSNSSLGEAANRVDQAMEIRLKGTSTMTRLLGLEGEVVWESINHHVTCKCSTEANINNNSIGNLEDLLAPNLVIKMSVEVVQVCLSSNSSRADFSRNPLNSQVPMGSPTSRLWNASFSTKVSLISFLLDSQLGLLSNY
jgi:hypothetical protein